MRSTKRSIIGAVVILIAVIMIMLFTGDSNSDSPENIQGDNGAVFDRQQPMDEEKMPIGNQEMSPGGQRVPQEAIDACSSLSEGDSCSFSTPRGDMSGTCSNTDGILDCKPER